MRIIFLDKDGVLNTSETYKIIKKEFMETGKRRIDLDLDRVELLKKIVDATGSKIVLTATCRKYAQVINGIFTPRDKETEQLLEVFEKYGLSIYDVTPVDYKQRLRQNEIKAWLKKNGDNVESFVIIDDESYDLKIFENKGLVVKTRIGLGETSVCTGLCENHVEDAIKKLLKK